MRKILASLIFAVLLAAPFTALASETGVQEFPDVSGHWAEDTIYRFVGYGVISGWDGLFRPQDNMTVAEFCAMLDMVMRYQDAAAYDPEVYKDLDENEWYAAPMLRLVQAGVIAPSRDCCRYTSTPTTVMPFCSTAIRSAPTRVLTMPPVPPVMAVPPRTTVAMELRM